ncbi:hypothetical protein DFH28DRAFT_222451 [Melampsora americana]|nr:hypothetical protein DFH28DRAFT_222451 [Melampsora americana]
MWSNRPQRGRFDQSSMLRSDILLLLCMDLMHTYIHLQASEQPTVPAAQATSSGPLGKLGKIPRIANKPVEQSSASAAGSKQTRRLKATTIKAQCINVEALVQSAKDTMLPIFAQYAAGAVDEEIDELNGAFSKVLSNLDRKKAKVQEVTASCPDDDDIEIVMEIYVPPKQEVVHATNKRKGVSENNVATKKSKTEPTSAYGPKRKARVFKSKERYDSEDEREDAILFEAERAKSGKVEAVDGKAQASKAASPTTEVNKEGSANSQVVPKKKSNIDPPWPLLEPTTSSIYHGSTVDLTKIFTTLSEQERSDIAEFEKQVKSPQYDWGVVLGPLMRIIIQGWEYEDITTLDKANSSSLESHIVRIKDMNDDNRMVARLQTAPRLLQLSAHDPVLTEDSINWKLVEDSMKYPWNNKSGFYRALSGMSCRTDTSPTWTKEPTLASNLTNGFHRLRVILNESLQHISHDSVHDSIVIRTEGENKVHADFVPMSQTIAWLYLQCTMRGSFEDDIKPSKLVGDGLAWFQRKLFLVFLGVMFVYEKDMYNRKLEDARRSKMTKKALGDLAREMKGQGCVRQLVENKIAKSHPTSKLLTGTTSKVKNQLEKSKETERNEIIKRQVFMIRHAALTSASLFFLYGTASLFHIWPDCKKIAMMDGAYLLMFTTILNARRSDPDIAKDHVFGGRAWNRLDAHLFGILQDFVTPAGRFKRNINWPEMTSRFNREFDQPTLAKLFTLDLQTEVVVPGLSRGLNGQVMRPVDIPDALKEDPSTAPSTEAFRSIFTNTEGQPQPVSERGRNLYPEVDSQTGKLTRPHNAVSKMTADKELAAIKRKVVGSKRSQVVAEEEEEEEEEEESEEDDEQKEEEEEMEEEEEKEEEPDEEEEDDDIYDMGYGLNAEERHELRMNMPGY